MKCSNLSDDQRHTQNVRNAPTKNPFELCIVSQYGNRVSMTMTSSVIFLARFQRATREDTFDYVLTALLQNLSPEQTATQPVPDPGSQSPPIQSILHGTQYNNPIHKKTGTLLGKV